MVAIPYVQGVTEKVARILRKHRVSAAMKPHTTLRQLLVSPKDKTDPKEGVYTIDCQNCELKYVGETKRKLKVRVKEHKEEVEKTMSEKKYTRASRKQSETDRWKSAITDHACQLNHVINWDSAKLIQRESDWFARGVREAISIRKVKNMNRDEGRHQLPHIYDDLLKPTTQD